MIRIYRTYPQTNNNQKIPEKYEDGRQSQNVPERTFVQSSSDKPKQEEQKTQQREPKEQNNDTFASKQKKKGSLFERVIPREIFDAKTGKLFGILSFEDLLLIALILILSSSEEEEDKLLLYVFLYVLLSDYIDLSDIF